MNGIISNVFGVFRNKEEYFEKIFDEKQVLKLILNQVIIISLFTFAYGLVMGAYNSVTQSLISGLKLPALFFLTLIVCFPAFFIIQLILGSKLKLKQMVAVILTGFVVISSLLLSFSLIVIFFMMTGNNYYFLQLMHTSIFLFSGFYGMMITIDILKLSLEKKDVYPKTGVTVFRIWAIILAFVGIQLAWNLRPFLGDKNLPFEMFRKHEGNFYKAMLNSANKLITKDEPHADRGGPKEINEPNSSPDPDSAEHDEDTITLD